MSGNERHAYSDFHTAPSKSFDLTTEKPLVHFGYGKNLLIPDAVGMPVTLFMFGRETGLSFPDRELFTFEVGDCRITKHGLFEDGVIMTSLNGPSDSSLSSIVVWTISRYGYELRVNGNHIASDARLIGNPEALFDRINGDSSLEIKGTLIFPRVLETEEKFVLRRLPRSRVGGSSFISEEHPYRNAKPQGKPGLVLHGSSQASWRFHVSLRLPVISGIPLAEFQFYGEYHSPSYPN